MLVNAITSVLTLVKEMLFTAVTLVLFIAMIVMMTKYREHRIELNPAKCIMYAIPGIVIIAVAAVLFTDDPENERTLLVNSVLWALEIWFILYTANVAASSGKENVKDLP